MRGTFTVRPGAFIATAALLSSLAGCSSLPAKPAGHLLVRPAEQEVSAPLNATRLGVEEALLLGPNFGLSLDWVFVAEEVEGEDAEDLGLGEGVRAADGHELIFAAVGNDDRFIHGRWGRAGETEAELDAKVTIGGRTRRLNTVPRPGSLLVVSVPKDTPAGLTVTDEGRPMSIDLRTGRSTGGLGDLPRLVDDLEYTGEGRVATPAGAASFGTDIRIDEATLEPYFPGAGWAKTGRAWLRLSLSQVSSDSLMQVTEDEPAVGYFVDPGATFEVRTQGMRLRAKGGLAFNTMRPAARYVAVVDVPASFRTGELRIAPDGPLFMYRGPSTLANYTNLSRVPDCGPGLRTVCLEWSRRPPARTVRIALS